MTELSTQYYQRKREGEKEQSRTIRREREGEKERRERVFLERGIY